MIKEALPKWLSLLQAGKLLPDDSLRLTRSGFHPSSLPKTTGRNPEFVAGKPVLSSAERILQYVRHTTNPSAVERQASDVLRESPRQWQQIQRLPISAGDKLTLAKAVKKFSETESRRPQQWNQQRPRLLFSDMVGNPGAINPWQKNVYGHYRFGNPKQDMASIFARVPGLMPLLRGINKVENRFSSTPSTILNPEPISFSFRRLYNLSKGLPQPVVQLNARAPESMRHEMGHWLASKRPVNDRARMLTSIAGSMQQRDPSFIQRVFRPYGIDFSGSAVDHPASLGGETLAQYLGSRTSGLGGKRLMNAAAQNYASIGANRQVNPRFKSVMNHLERNYNVPALPSL